MVLKPSGNSASESPSGPAFRADCAPEARLPGNLPRARLARAGQPAAGQHGPARAGCAIGTAGPGPLSNGGPRAAALSARNSRLRL